MEFEWNPATSDRRLRERGFAFIDILPAFADPGHFVELDLRFDYGEDRYQLYGHVRGRLYVIVFTRRGSAFRIISARKATDANGVMRAWLEPDGSIVEILDGGVTRPIPPGTDWSFVDATSESDLARHAREDEALAIHDAARWTRGVRRRLGLSQTNFSRRIGVPLAKVRDWESGRQAPAGPERVLLRLIAYPPRTALAVLTD